jgi:predicted site-specific integrase-resolvase
MLRRFVDLDNFSLSTSQVARTVGVHKRTLLAWLYAGRVAEPTRQNNGSKMSASGVRTTYNRFVGSKRLTIEKDGGARRGSDL